MAATNQEFAKIDSIYELHKSNLQVLKDTNASDRIRKLKALNKYLRNELNQEKLQKAMYADFKKPAAEVTLTEVIPCLSHLTEVIGNLRKWMRPKSLPIPLVQTGLSANIIYEPKGQALVISPWNYPFMLGLYPVIYAIAAGCSVILKPSELTPNTSKFLEEMFHSTMAENEVRVVQGAIPETTHLLSKEWGHIFFTGSPQVGKIIMGAASKTLTSVSLELGGKSPCIIDETANIKSTAQKLVWGKFVNAGQTCTAPDYVLVHESKKEKLIEELQKYIRKQFGDKPQSSESLARIITKRHAERLKDMIQNSAKNKNSIVIGGESDIDDLYIAPTVLQDIEMNSPVMQEEIFGPILPILTYKQKEEVTTIIRSMDKPLSSYICSRSRKNINYFLENTTAGGALVNEFLLGAAIPSIPFGGVNSSGIGKAFGEHGFIEFSNEKPVIRRNFMTISFVYPPYNKTVVKVINFLKKLM